jgi:membrane fusion protein (multidrug efflux system)
LYVATYNPFYNGLSLYRFLDSMKISRVILIISITVVTGLLIRKVFFGKDEKSPAGGSSQKSVARLSGYIAAPTAAETNINSSGSLISSEEVILRPEASGKIVKLTIREGLKVTKGELLMKLNDDELLASRKKLQTTLDLAKQMLARQKSLLEGKAIGQEEYDIAANEVAVIEADMEYNEALIRKTEVRAPFSGKVGLKYVSEGSYVTPATMIAVLHQLDPLKLDFSVPERYAGRVKPGDAVHFTVDGNKEVFQASLFAIEPKIDPATRTLKMRALVSNPSGKLFPGAFARVKLNLGNSEVLMIPTQAVIPILKGKKVFISQQGIAVTREIETGERNATMVEVTGGLVSGDTVITSGIMQLRDSMPVQVKVTNGF